jgi:hypothetical protein
MSFVLENLFTRKFLFSIATLAVAAVALYIAKITSSEFIELVKWLGATFMGANAIEGVAQVFNKE